MNCGSMYNLVMKKLKEHSNFIVDCETILYYIGNSTNSILKKNQ